MDLGPLRTTGRQLSNPKTAKTMYLKNHAFLERSGWSIKASGFRIDYEGCIRGWSCIGAFNG